jgi:hypothetical protein
VQTVSMSSMKFAIGSSHIRMRSPSALLESSATQAGVNISPLPKIAVSPA